MKKHFLPTLLFVSSLFLFNACEDDIEIITDEATNITNYTANVTCRVKGDVSLDDSECGAVLKLSRRAVLDAYHPAGEHSEACVAAGDDNICQCLDGSCRIDV